MAKKYFRKLSVKYWLQHLNLKRHPYCGQKTAFGLSLSTNTVDVLTTMASPRVMDNLFD